MEYGRTSTVGFSSASGLGLKGTLIQWKDREIRFPLVGEFNLENALCAISIAEKIGVPDALIVEGLENVEPLFGRGEIIEGNVTVLQDCYNANSDSMLRALDFVSSISWTGRKILVLGSMKEMGAESEFEHRLVGRYAADSRADALFFFGDESAAAYAAAKEAGGTTGMIEWTADFDDLRMGVESYVRRGDLVLVKGSRAAEMERLTEVLVAVN